MASHLMALVENLVQDLRYAVRALRKNPGFAAVAIGTFAFAIGANTAIFSVVNAALLRPLPYPDPAKLVFLWSGSADRGSLYSFSYPRFASFRDHAGRFASVAAYDDEMISFSDRGEPQRIEGGRVSKEFFGVLGIQPVLGRSFSEAEDQPGGPPVAMLSHHLWQERYGARADVLGQAVRIDGQNYTVIGVLPAGFQFLSQPVEVWRPKVFETGTYAPASVRLGAYYLTVIARLRPGATLAEAQAHIAVLDARYRRENPGNSDVANPVHAALLRDQVFAGIRLNLMVLWASVTCLLLIACANVANLLLARATGRRQEITVRLALGAGRTRIAQQLLTESVLIAACGGLLALPLASGGVELLVAALRHSGPPVPDAGLDGSVMAFTLAISVAVGIGFGLAPVFFSLGGNLDDGLRAGSRGLSGPASRVRFRSGLVAGEIALSLALLTAAGLLAQSFLRMRGQDAGLEPRRVLAMPLVLMPDRYDLWEQRTAFYDEVLRRVGQLPGVSRAGITTRIDLVQPGLGYLTQVEGAPDLGPQNPLTRGRSITPGYLRVLEIPLVRGREFTSHDNTASPRVMLVNESFARRFFPGRDPIGRHVTYSTDRITCEIVGVVHDVRSSPGKTQANEEVYLPLAQRPWLVARLVVRTAGNPAGVAAGIRQAVQAVDPDQAVASIDPLQRTIEGSLDQPRTTMFLVLVFAAAALLLAAIGIYGVMAYTVAQRSREIGIRLALGARTTDVRSLVIWQSMRLALAGVALGIPLALLLGRLYGSMLFGVRVWDPWTLAGVATLLPVVAAGSSWLPAMRATRVDPVVVLRAE